MFLSPYDSLIKEPCSGFEMVSAYGAENSNGRIWIRKDFWFIPVDGESFSLSLWLLSSSIMNSTYGLW